MKKTRRGGGKPRDDFCLRVGHITFCSPEYISQLLVASPQIVETLSSEHSPILLTLRSYHSARSSSVVKTKKVFG